MSTIRRKAGTHKTHAARKPAGGAKGPKPARKKRKTSRKKKLGPIARVKQRFADWRDRILGYKVHAMVSAAGILAITLYVAWAAGVGIWIKDEVNDASQSALVASGLSVEQIRLEGRNRADLDEVRQAIGVIQGESILHYDIDAARARLESIEWVEDAQVIRFLPRTIHVVLKERSPVAIWQMDGELFLVDHSGYVINGFSDKLAAKLPLIVGEGAPAQAADLFATLGEYPAIKDNFASAIRVADRRWNIRLTNGVEIRLPAENIRLALSRVVKYDADHDLLRQEIKSVDLRLPDRVYLKLTDEEAERLWTPQTKT